MKYKIVEAVSNRNDQSVHEYITDDEIDLIALLRAFLKHKRLILSILAIAALAGLLGTFFIAAKYPTTTRLEIGAYQNFSNNENGSLIESPTAVVAKLKSGYIPREIYKFEDTHGVILPDDLITVSSPKKSNIIILHSKGRKQEAEKLSQLQKLSVQALLNDHNQRFTTIEEELRIKLSRAEQKLVELENEELYQLALDIQRNKVKQGKNALNDIQDNIKTIQANIENLKFDEELIKDQEKILSKQLSEVSKLLTNMDQQRENAVKHTSDSNSVMTLMLLDNERRQLYDNQSRITNQLNLDLKEKNHNLRNKRQQSGFELNRARRNEKSQTDTITHLEGEIIKFKYQRNQEIKHQRQNIEALNTRLSAIIPTRIIVGPVQSSSEQSSRWLILPMSMILGVFLALLLVGLLEVIKKVRTEEKGQLTPV